MIRIESCFLAVSFLPAVHRLICGIRQKCNMTCSLDCRCKSSLMSCTGSGDSSGKNLASLGDISLESVNILVGNCLVLLSTEDANLLSSADHASPCGSLSSFLISLYRFIVSHYVFLLFDLIERQLFFHSVGNVHEAVACGCGSG